MKTSFVIPTHLYKYAYPAPLSMSDFPVGFAYVAASVRAAGHSVAGCNPNNRFDYSTAREMLEDVLARHLDEHRPDVVALGGICTDYAFVRDAMRIVRKRSNARILLGGSIVGYDPDRIVNILKPDYALKGDSEHTAVMLMNELNAGREPSKVPNLIYRWDGRVKKNAEDFHYPDIATHLYPAFELFDAKSMLDDFSLGARPLYRYPHEHGKPWVVVAGRGCPFRCTFCVHERETPYSFRKPADVMAELEHFRKEYDFNIVIVLDELFAPNRKRMTEFCNAMIEMRERLNWDLRWCMQTHANVGLKQEDIHLARRAGMYEFSYGMESASLTVLKSMRKKAEPDQIEEVIPMARRARVGFGGNYIFGDPAETPATINETMTFFKAHCRDLHMSLGSIQPYPGSQIYDKCLKDGTIPDPGAFYEAIDEKRFCLADFPVKQWTTFCSLVAFLGGKGLWHLPARARVAAQESNPHFEILTLDAVCPHCTERFTFRHAWAARREDKAIAVKQSPVTQTLLKFKRKRWFLRLVLFYAALMARRHGWFAHLKALARAGAETERSVVTGCPACNAAVRLEWPKPRHLMRTAAAAWPQNTGNSLHFATQANNG